MSPPSSHSLHPRVAEPRLLEALADSPVVLIHGPRQCGKTTLARRVGDPRGFAYISFDDEVMLAAARSDPIGFVDGLPDRVILDEVQHVPDLFRSIKAAVDRMRSHGRFLLTGSANVLLLPRLAESLAGRMSILRLHPLAQSEIEADDVKAATTGFLDALFEGGHPTRKLPRLGPELARRIVGGGYPPALARPTPRRLSLWYRDYVDTLVQRDVRELARIRSLDALPRLLAAAAGQTARLLNVADLAAPFELSRPTVRDYLTLLEQVFLVEELPPWHANRLSRLIKAPKLHVCDTGVACSLLGLDAAALANDRVLLGQLAETFVLQELRRLASGYAGEIRFHHYRDKDGGEDDVVLELGAQRLAGVDVKAGATVTASDFRGLRRLKDAAGKRLVAGVVLYDGESIASFGDGFHALPIRMLWEPRGSRSSRRATS